MGLKAKKKRMRRRKIDIDLTEVEFFIDYLDDKNSTIEQEIDKLKKKIEIMKNQLPEEILDIVDETMEAVRGKIHRQYESNLDFFVDCAECPCCIISCEEIYKIFLEIKKRY